MNKQPIEYKKRFNFNGGMIQFYLILQTNLMVSMLSLVGLYYINPAKYSYLLVEYLSILLIPPTFVSLALIVSFIGDWLIDVVRWFWIRFELKKKIFGVFGVKNGD